MNNINIFKDEIKNTFLFHIPHSSFHIPSTENMDIEYINDELIYSTDVMVDQIFNIKDIDKHICGFSRVFCDVERFNDINEEMNLYGRGICYTNTYNDKIFKTCNEKYKNDIITSYYNPYHKELEEKIRNKIEKYGICRIVDCHSFNETKLYFENNNKRPDICLGVNQYTPKYLLDFIKNGFEKYNFSVEINSPYSGSYYPLNIKGKFETIMIEINKKLYMENDENIKLNNVFYLKDIIEKIFTFD